MEKTSFRKHIAKSASARWLVFSALLTLGALAHEGRADSNFVAIVMEISGDTRPPLSVHREVTRDTRIDLAPGARVALLHYSSCSIVTVKGGTATVTDQGVEVNASDVESRKPGPCPRVHRITHTGPGPLGGVVVTRGEPKTYADVALDSDVVLSGNAAADAREVEILDLNGRPIGSRIAVRGASFKLDGTLAPGRAYVLHISFNGQNDPLDVPVVVSPPKVANVLIIRLE